jgi:hypothetical protein
MSAPRGSKFAAATLAAFATLALGACSFVQMAPGAAEVRVVGPGQLPAGCVKRGEVEVSVKDSLGPYERSEMRVKDELETLARNEAPGLGADTVQPKAPPADGGQRFLAFHCGATAPTTSAAPPELDDRAAETSPLKDN